MSGEHCKECDDKDAEIRGLKDKLDRTQDRLDEAVEHLREIEREACGLYERIKTSF
jgi:predicted nuclease with TOPRIM domain